MEVEPQTSYIGSLEGQTHFGMPRGAKLNLTLNEPKQVALHSFECKHYL